MTTAPGRHPDHASGSLCTGYGGLDLAVELVLGGRLAWYAETDRHARTVLAHHWPGVPNLGDIRAVDWTTVEPVDVLTAGFPCQDISNAGKRAGIGGKHSSLWTCVADAVRCLRPPLVFVENVAALLQWGLDAVEGDLAAIGYDTGWLCLRVSDIGAAHRRDRLFLLYLDTFRSWRWISQDASERSSTTCRSRTESLRVKLIMVPVAAEVC